MPGRGARGWGGKEAPREGDLRAQGSRRRAGRRRGRAAPRTRARAGSFGRKSPSCTTLLLCARGCARGGLLRRERPVLLGVGCARVSVRWQRRGRRARTPSRARASPAGAPTAVPTAVRARRGGRGGGARGGARPSISPDGSATTTTAAAVRRGLLRGLRLPRRACRAPSGAGDRCGGGAGVVAAESPATRLPAGLDSPLRSPRVLLRC